MRLFLAVLLEKAMCDALERAIASIPVPDPPWRYTARESWHITLRFLGECDAADEARVSAAVAPVASSTAPFSIALGGFDAFPSRSRPRVLVFRVDTGTPALAALALRIEAALGGGPAGDLARAPGRKPLRPHITVARVRTRIPAPTARLLRGVGSPEPAGQHVAAIALVESHLGSSGARYTVRKLFALGGGA